MNNFIIAYDLNNQKNYTNLIETINQYSNAIHLQQSLWFVTTSQTSTEVMDTLSELIDSDDFLLVIEPKHLHIQTTNEIIEQMRLNSVGHVSIDELND